MKILSSFTHPQGVVNLYEFLSPAEHKRKYFEEFRKTMTPLMDHIDIQDRKNIYTMEVNGY